jgi:hypothetical protein
MGFRLRFSICLIVVFLQLFSAALAGETNINDAELTGSQEVKTEVATVVPGQESGQEEIVVEPVIDEEELDKIIMPDEIPFENSDLPGDVSELAADVSEPVASLPEKLYEKVDAIDPVLMMRGQPIEEQKATTKRLQGRIVPEKHSLGRRNYFYRWVLKTKDDKRIPLKSDLKLLTLIRKESLLDGLVLVTGKFVQSKMNEQLRYFKVERIVPAEIDLEADEEKEEK